MNKEQKGQVISELSEKFASSLCYYFADGSGMSVEKTDKFRRECFKKGFEYVVVKNTLIEKALERNELADSAPASLLKEFSKNNNGLPAFKGAIVESSYFAGADQLDALVALKSKNELIGEVIGLLQSPIKNVVSGLKSSGSTIAGVLKTLSER
jgi:large subunit ribosomal protein L10